jgi:hypothetical protein
MGIYLKRKLFYLYENGQSYAGNCIEERVPFPPAAYMYVDSVVGSVFSAPGNVSGKFKFIYK